MDHVMVCTWVHGICMTPPRSSNVLKRLQQHSAQMVSATVGRVGHSFMHGHRYTGQPDDRYSDPETALQGPRAAERVFHSHTHSAAGPTPP